MHFFKNFQPTPMKIFQLGLVLIAALLALSIAAQLFAPSLTGMMPPGLSMPGTAPTMGYGGGSDGSYAVAPDYGYNGDYDMMAKEESMAYGSAQLSTRNAATAMPSSIAPMPPMTTPGDEAEKFEVTDYNASFETRSHERVCDAFIELKAKEYVIFENSNSYDRGCSFTFKVERTRVDEVLTWLKGLDPKYLNENTYTIKRQIDDFTSEEDILKKKLVEIDDTLKDATSAYADVTRIATQSNDASSLAQIIQGRIQIIQQLTQERLNVSAQLDRLARAKTDSLDRIDYTYFRVDVTENPYIDTDSLKESWKQSIRDVVHVINGAVQGVTINLIAILALVLQYALYALGLLLLAKIGWNIAVRIWKS